MISQTDKKRMNVCGTGTYATVIKIGKFAFKKYNEEGQEFMEEEINIYKEIVPHENIANVYMGENYTALVKQYRLRVPTLIMDYYDTTISQYLDRFIPIKNKIRLNFIKDAIRGVFTGLSHLESKGIIHGDIKASNIMVNELGEVKLIDFNGSYKIDIKNHDYGSNFKYCTPITMPPEAILGYRKCCHKGDVWSAGITILMIIDCGSAYRCVSYTEHQKFEIISWLSAQYGDLSQFETFSCMSSEELNEKYLHFKISKKMPMLHNDAMGTFFKYVLHPDPLMRPSASEVLQHPFLNDYRKE